MWNQATLALLGTIFVLMLLTFFFYTSLDKEGKQSFKQGLTGVGTDLIALCSDVKSKLDAGKQLDQGKDNEVTTGMRKRGSRQSTFTPAVYEETCEEKRGSRTELMM